MYQEFDLETQGERGSPQPKHPALEPSNLGQCVDIALYARNTSSLNTETRFNLLTHHFKPFSDYLFAKGTNGRSFQHRWLQMFLWLVYSKQENGGYCLPCVLFATARYHRWNRAVLVSCPLASTTKSLELLHKHANKEHHKIAVVRSDSFLLTTSNQQQSIECVMSRPLANKVAENRQKLGSIVKTIVLCGRHNVPLRGHHDSATHLERDIEGTCNHSNFLALLDFRVEAGDTVLGEHLSKADRNATYTQGNIQNQIIDVLADQVREKL